jgi:hypothetical protein
MPDFSVVGQGDTKDIESSLTQVEQRLAELNSIQAKAQAGARDLAGGLGLTSKELSAAARSAGLTSGELKKLIKEEAITTEEAKKLAAAQREADASTKGLKQSSADAANSLNTLVKGAVAFVGTQLVQEAAKAAQELYNLGAASERARFSLNALSDGHADEFIEAIQSASRNTVSEMDAMTIANKALQFGIVANAEEMGRLTEVAVALGRVMGTDATKAFDDLTTAGARQSKLIADNLGIIIDMNRVSTDAAVLMRQNASLTEDQARAQAFLNQIVAAGTTEQMQAILANQDAAETTERLSANMADLAERGGRAVAEFFKPTIDGANAAAGGLLMYLDAMDDVKRRTAEGTDSFAEYVDQLNKAGVVTDAVAEAYRRHGDAIFTNVGFGMAETQVLRQLQKEFLELEQNTDQATRAQIEMDAAARASYYNTQYGAEVTADLTAALSKLTEQNRELDPAIIGVIEALKAGNITVEDANDRLRDLGATEADVSLATMQLAESQQAAEQAARAHEQALRDQQREHEALAGIVGSTSQDIAEMGAAAWAQSEQSGQAYLEFLRAAGVDLSQFPGKYDEIRLAAGLVTEEELKVEQGLRLLSEAMGKIDPTMGLHLFEEWSSGAITDINELQARIDDLTKPINATQAEHAMELAEAQANQAVTQMEKQAKAGQEAFDKARIAAQEDLAEVNVALGKVSETLDGVADVVERSFGRMAEGANDTATAIGHIASSAGDIVGPLAALPSVAASAFGALGSMAASAANAVTTIALSAVAAANAVTTIATAATTADNAMAGMARSADNSYGSIDAVRGSVAVLRSHWEWLQRNRTLDLVANYTQNGNPGGGGGGYVPESLIPPLGIGLEGTAPPMGRYGQMGQSVTLQNFGPIYVYPTTAPLALSDILIDVTAQLAPAYMSGAAE